MLLLSKIVCVVWGVVGVGRVILCELLTSCTHTKDDERLYHILLIPAMLHKH